MSMSELESPALIEEETSAETVPENAAPAQEPVQLEQIRDALAGLQQQFSEKIAADAHKNALFDQMYQQLIRYQNGVVDKLVETMALDIIQLVDSTKRSLEAYEEKEPTEENYRRLLNIVGGLVEDLVDILYRQSIEPYQTPGEEVDVRRQKILQTVETDRPELHNLVAQRLAEGYERDGKVIRPERIKIYKCSTGEGKEN